MENNYLPPIPTGEELERQCNEAKYACLEPYRLDPAKEWEPIQYTLFYGGVGFAPKGDVQAVKAPQKNGKTFLLTLLMGAALKGEYMGIKCSIKAPRILFIDTEQHPRNTLLVYRRICCLAELDGHKKHEQISVLHLRGAETEFINEAIQMEIERFKPDIACIDGAVDCVIDPNDMKESKSLLSVFSKIALENNCSIWMVLHVNPGSEKMRGHLGTVLSQKSSDVLACIKTKGTDGTVFYDVEQTDSRNQSITKFAFAIENKTDSYGNLIAIPVPPHISVKERSSLDDLFKNVLSEKPLKRAELAERIKEETGKKKTRSYELINDGLNSGIIYEDKVMGKIHYKGLDLPNEEELPF